jgi:hypothetical protein
MMDEKNLKETCRSVIVVLSPHWPHLSQSPSQPRVEPSWAVPYLRRLIAGFTSRRSRFDSRPGHVGCMVVEVALKQVL